MSRLRYDEIKGTLIINCEHLTAEDIEAIWALSSNEVDEDIGRHGIVVSRSRKTVSERKALLVQHLEEQECLDKPDCGLRLLQIPGRRR